MRVEIGDQLTPEASDQPTQLGIEPVPGTGDQTIALDPDGHAAISQDADDLLRIGHQKITSSSSLGIRENGITVEEWEVFEESTGLCCPVGGFFE